jgi:hypothetical protein
MPTIKLEGKVDGQPISIELDGNDDEDGFFNRILSNFYQE